MVNIFVEKSPPLKSDRSGYPILPCPDYLFYKRNFNPLNLRICLPFPFFCFWKEKGLEKFMFKHFFPLVLMQAS